LVSIAVRNGEGVEGNEEMGGGEDGKEGRIREETYLGHSS